MIKFLQKHGQSSQALIIDKPILQLLKIKNFVEVSTDGKKLFIEGITVDAKTH